MALKISINLASLRAALASDAASVDLVLEGDTVVAVAGASEEPPPPSSPIGGLPPEVLLGWYDVSGVGVAAGACSAWTDKSTHSAHLQQASAGRRPAVGQHALGQGLAVRGDGASAYLASMQTVTGAVTCFLVASHQAPPIPRGGAAEAPPAFAMSGGASADLDGWQACVCQDGIAHPSGAMLVGQQATNSWLVSPGLGLGGTCRRDGELGADVGPQRRRHVYEITRDAPAVAGHLRLLAYPPAAGSSTEGQLWSRSSIFEVVLLSGAATEEQRAAVRADLIARHTTAPLVVCDGDSLVAGNGVLTTEAWPSLLWERYGATVDVVNLGIPGRTAQQIRAAGVAPYSALVRQASRRVLLLAAGVNDLRSGRPPATVWQDLCSHALAAQDEGWEVALCLLAPSPDTETTHPGAIAALNNLILAWWAGPLVDLRTVASLLPDGLHYDAAGQAEAAALVGEMVDDLL